MELIKIENGIALLDNTEFVNEFIKEQKLVDALNESIKIKKEMLLKEMEDKNILKIDTDTLNINYIAQSERETFDSKSFREDNPDLYDEYVKFSPVKSSIRIKVN